jgi:putative transposase
MAFNRFFKKQAKFPRFKKKGVHDSFRADNGSNDVVVKDKKIKLPVIGWVRLREPVRFAGQIKSAVVSRKAGKWFVALSFELEDQPCTHENQGVVGVDLGIKTMAVCSNGLVFESPKPLSKRIKALRRAQRILSRRQKQSANRKKAAARVAKLHYKVSCIRSDALHKATTAICRSAYVIVLEDLNVKGMMRNRKLSRAISDIGMYEFYRQCEYKAREIYTIPRFFASSKTCSDCGELSQNLTLSVRDWTCGHCGSCHDRDENAAKNLEQYYTVRSAEINACGETGSDVAKRETGLAEARNKLH